MAKAGARRRRKRRWLRRLGVALLVLVALTGTAFGIVTLKLRAIVLSALRKQLPNCEVSVGRVALSPPLSLSVYDLKIEDRSRPEAPSTITVERVTADVSLAALFKFDIDLDVAAPAIVLENVSGDPPPFADLFERERKAPSDRFLVRRLDVRDCAITIREPGLAINTTLQVQLINPPRGTTDEPTRLKVALENFGLRSGGLVRAPLGGSPGDSPDVEVGGPAADGPLNVTGAITIGTLQAEVEYAGEGERMSDRVLVRRLSARDCAIAIDEPGTLVSSKLQFELRDATLNGSGESARLKAVLDGFEFESGGVRTVPLKSSLDVTLAVRPAEDAADVGGTITIGDLAGELEGRVGLHGMRVEAEFAEHEADTLLGILRRDGEYKIGFLHDFETLTGTVSRLGVVVLSGPAVVGGVRIEGELEAEGLNGRSGSMKMEVEGMAITEPVVLAAPPGGGPMALSVGDPSRTLDPGRITAKKVTFQKYVATDVRGTLWMRDNNWTLEAITGTLYGGEGTGSIRALAGGTLQFKLAFDDVDLEPVFATVGREGDQVTGRAEGVVALTVGSDGVIKAIEGHLKTKPPGGRIKIKDADDLLKEAPGGKQVYEAITQGLPSNDPESFFDKFKDFDYESVEIGTGMLGETFVTTLHVKERAERDPLELEIKFNYIREVIEH